MSVGVIAQWQSAGSLGQRPWVHLPAAPPFIRALCRFKGLWTVMAQIVSFTRCYHYRSSDHRGFQSIKVPSIGLLHYCDSACDLSHQTGDAINFQHWPIWLCWPMACPPPDTYKQTVASIRSQNVRHTSGRCCLRRHTSVVSTPD